MQLACAQPRSLPAPAAGSIARLTSANCSRSLRWAGGCSRQRRRPALVAAAAAAIIEPAGEHPVSLASPPCAFELRDYQEEAVQAILDALTRGVTRQLVSLPTGAWRREAGGPFALHAFTLVQQAGQPAASVTGAPPGACRLRKDSNHVPPGTQAGLAHAGAGTPL